MDYSIKGSVRVNKLLLDKEMSRKSLDLLVRNRHHLSWEFVQTSTGLSKLAFITNRTLKVFK